MNRTDSNHFNLSCLLKDIREISANEAESISIRISCEKIQDIVPLVERAEEMNRHNLAKDIINYMQEEWNSIMRRREKECNVNSQENASTS